MSEQIKTRAEIFQDYVSEEINGILDRLETVDADLKKSVSAHSRDASERALLMALDKVMEPARSEINLMVAEIKSARAQLGKDAAAVRKELLGNTLDTDHPPQDDFSMVPFYWAVAMFLTGITLGGYAVWILKS